ncbi:MAG: hypothetical protein MJ102_03325 [Clostridia bacterium]|nr:hypothetical protein [Clostridia bacterium]
MKRILALILAIMLLTLLAACDNGDGADTTQHTADSSSAPADNTTASFVDDSTTAPADDTTGAPTDDTTAAPADDTTAAPADDTTAAPADDTTAVPETTTSAPETTASPAPTPIDFEKLYDGTWTNSTGMFIDFDCENGTPTAFFAIWNAGGFMPAGEITAVKTEDFVTWEITIHHNKVELHEDNDRPELITDVIEAYDEEIVLQAISGEKFNFSYKGRTNEWNDEFSYYPQYQFPDPQEMFLF